MFFLGGSPLKSDGKHFPTARIARERAKALRSWVLLLTHQVRITLNTLSRSNYSQIEPTLSSSDSSLWVLEIGILFLLPFFRSVHTILVCSWANTTKYPLIHLLDIFFSFSITKVNLRYVLFSYFFLVLYQNW